jgi:ATP-dependent helicase/nuclease subunit B
MSNNRLMTLERQRLPADARFWTEAGLAVRAFAARCGAPERRLQGIQWLVPCGEHAVQARAALRDALGGAAFAPPRISPLAAWLGRPLDAGTAARAELYVALRGNAWAREAFGDQPATLWSLARDVARLSDELTWAAIDGHEAFEGRLAASLARHFHRRAAMALRPQAQLVLQLWQARRSAEDGASGAWRELAARSAQASVPLVYLSRVAVTDSADDGLAAWERAFIERWADRAPVLLLVPDLVAALNGEPLLKAAWPELAGSEVDVPIARRADALRGAEDAQHLPLTIVDADSLEDEASAVARQVIAWRSEGLGSIALVALDRLTARRVRALLERAQVSVRDETGWRLSTTSAAAAVMRWYDLVADDFYWRDLLDWLKSSFTLSGRTNKAQEIQAFERAIRASGALQGARAMRLALVALDRDGTSPPAAGAREVLGLLEEQARGMRRTAPTLAAHARALQATLDALGMRAALLDDPVGRDVLREVDGLALELDAAGGRARVEEFRALLAARFEEVAYVDREVDSPVTMVSLAATALRTFDAAVLIGADEDHLPTAPGELLFFSNDVRAELRLATADAALREQAGQLAALLAATPRVIATWRRRRGDEPNALSPLLERLRFVAARATGDDLARRSGRDSFEVEPVALECPAPRAAALLPARLSASHAQSLVNCPYQFYARRLLRLEPPEDVLEAPGKREFGEALHEVLQRFHLEWGTSDLGAIEPDRLRLSLVRHATAVFTRDRERMPGLLAYERRFVSLVDDYISWAQQQSSAGWRWSAAEQALAHPLDIGNGRAVELTGRLDRIDRRSDGALTVLDYKARNSEDLKRGLKIAGEDIQLPFYGLLLRNSPLATGQIAAAYVAFDRGREGASGVQTVAPPQPYESLVEEVGSRLQADLRRIADGAPLPALGAPSVCEYCEMRGLCRRDYWERDTEVDA